MTPKEKAKELVSKFNYSYDEENKRYIFHQDIDASKRSALILVDEMIYNCDNTIVNEFIKRGAISYWQEVKQEIELL